MEELVPDRLKAFWHAVERQQRSAEEYSREHERLLAQYQRIWEQALRLEGSRSIQESLLVELARYTQCDDLVAVQRRCEQAVTHVKQDWMQKVQSNDRRSIEQFYNQSQAMIDELMWWHTLGEDLSPLSYVTALQFARQRTCRDYLDFGAGVGSGALLFARHGLQVSLADISSRLLQFSRWRFDLRRLPAQFINLSTSKLPSQAFDLITAMDVFEHLVDPVEAVEQLWMALKPGGFLFTRLGVEVDEERPQHIVRDFGPTFERLRALGFVEVWRDEWLWGHQVFQKSRG